ncbi:MAG: hypothetical protein AUI08_06765 [Gemmatimonadetes bacterium 13_2_20CM_2_65_7]|nr:MAG: hypothetical protein AUI08_06765 [Gemmatimonadetes bacterium 13_2_20CM_2_65_7]OLD03552.1 MAG: hypothetical protein AUI89_01210 [Gemmatimonadetes bacterium 13_1_40CM_3_65_8]
MTDLAMHLTTDEIELWAQGLLPATRAMHLADCSLCRVEAERERKVILELVQLPQFSPRAGFADRVMAQVKVPTPSGDWTT